MSKVYVGLDEGSTSCFLYCVDEEGNFLHKDRIPTNDQSIVSTFSSISGELHVMIEAATISGHIYYLLEPIVHRVVISEPKTNTHIGQASQKGDAHDAKKLAKLLRLDSFKNVWMPDNKDRWVFRQLVSHYDELVQISSSIASRIHARYLMNGVFDRNGLFEPETKAQLIESIPYRGTDSMFDQLYQTYRDLQTQREEAKKNMVQFSRRFDEIPLFLDVPGVGDVVACRFSGYIGNPHRFETNKQVRKYSSLAISSRSSDGKQLGYERLDKAGRNELKDASYKAALSAISGSNALSDFYNKKKRKTRSKTKARLSTQRKIVDILWNLWRKKQKYDPEKVFNRTRELVIEQRS